MSWSRFEGRSAARGALRSGAKAGGPDGKPARPKASTVWRESRELLWAHRRRLALGLGLMLVNRLAGLVLPATSKFSSTR